MISSSCLLRHCAAASSRASGIPSNRRQIVLTAAIRSVRSGTPASRARSRNSRTASVSASTTYAGGVAKGPSTSSDSPGRSRGDRLVASTRGDSHEASRASTASAAAAVTCSQLSTTTRAGCSVGELSSASKDAKPELSRDRARHVGPVVHPGQVDKVGAERIVGAGLPGDRHRQRRLATSSAVSRSRPISSISRTTPVVRLRPSLNPEPRTPTTLTM
jgi:hypothetical protein